MHKELPSIVREGISQRAFAHGVRSCKHLPYAWSSFFRNGLQKRACRLSHSAARRGRRLLPLRAGEG